MTKWSEWVEGSNLISPPVEVGSMVTTWGFKQPPPTRPSVGKLVHICKAYELESIWGQWRVRDILCLVGPTQHGGNGISI